MHAVAGISASMKIGVDARPLAGPPTGIGIYLSELLKAVARLDAEHEFLLYAHRPLAFDIPDGRFRVRVRRVRTNVGPLWLQLYAPGLAEADGVDVFWGAHFLLPVRLPRRIPAIVTVYDLVPFLFPQTMQLSTYLVTRLFLPASLARAKRIVVISDSVAADVRRIFRLSRDRISVVTPGVRAGFGPRDPVEARHRMVERLGLDPQRPYLLTVGTVEPRKNLLMLVNAVASLPKETRARFSLLIAGAPGWKMSALRNAALPLVREGTVRFLGFVGHDDLPWLSAGASLFLFPSLYEGFGMPMVEAMASGVPVIASDIPVTREVAADAVLFVKPLDVDRWGHVIAEMINDEPRRRVLGEAGRRRSAEFTFEESARRLLAVVEGVVRNRDSERSPLISRTSP